MRLIGMAGRRVGFNDCVGNELLGGGGKMVGQRDTQMQMVIYKNGASYLLLPSGSPTPRGRTYTLSRQQLHAIGYARTAGTHMLVKILSK